MEELLSKQRKEKKELQNKITSKKKNANKKTRKGVNDECEALERELADRHDAEIMALSGGGNGQEANGDNAPSEDEDAQINRLRRHSSAEELMHEMINGTSSISFSEPRDRLPSISEAVPPEEKKEPKKVNRNKARLARRAAERDALANEAADEAQYMPDLKAREREQMLSEFGKRGLQEKEIRADGHCLYSAVANGLKLHDISLRPRILANSNVDEKTEDYRVVRKTAAAYIKSQPDDFAPFLEEPLDSYVHKVADTGEWGGQLELMALAKAYGVDISVLQGDGRIEEIEGEGQDKSRIWLAYYKHGFGLGEHYNSLSKVS